MVSTCSPDQSLVACTCVKIHVKGDGGWNETMDNNSFLATKQGKCDERVGCTHTLYKNPPLQ